MYKHRAIRTHTRARSLTHKITLRSIHAFSEPPRASEGERERELTEITTIRWMEWNGLGMCGMEDEIVITVKIHISHFHLPRWERAYILCFILFYRKNSTGRILFLFFLVARFFSHLADTFHARRVWCIRLICCLCFGMSCAGSVQRIHVTCECVCVCNGWKCVFSMTNVPFG